MTRHTFTRFAVAITTATVVVIGMTMSGGAQILAPKQPSIPITVLLPSPDTLVEITAGAYHTCVRKYDGSVYCWGLNGWSSTTGGQIGVGYTAASVSTSTCKDAAVQNPMHPIIAPTTNRPCVDQPAFVIQLHFAPQQIVAGDYHTCALSGGIASCWGADFPNGQLGDGGQTDRGVPWNVSTSAVFTRLAAGTSSTCGLSPSGIFCWGVMPYNCGLPPYPNPPPVLPTYETTPFALYASSVPFTSIAVGNKFMCVLAGAGLQRKRLPGYRRQRTARPREHARYEHRTELGAP